MRWVRTGLVFGCGALFGGIVVAGVLIVVGLAVNAGNEQDERERVAAQAAQATRTTQTSTAAYYASVAATREARRCGSPERVSVTSTLTSDHDPNLTHYTVGGFAQNTCNYA